MPTDPYYGVEFPVFTLHTDPDTGREWVTVDDLPQRIAVEQHVLDHADKALATIRKDGDRIRIEVANGWCSYRVVLHDEHRQVYVCERLGVAFDRG